MLLSCGCVEKLGGDEEVLGRVDSGAADVAAAVDPATGHLYVDDGVSVGEWDTGGMNGQTYNKSTQPMIETNSGTEVSSFGTEQLSSNSTRQQGGIAVNGVSGDIYVSNPVEGKVDIFSTVVPAVAVDAATGVNQTAATLNGTVDPRGAPLSFCKFEYGTSASYGQEVPCDLTPLQIGSGTGPVAVSADIGGLQTGILYHFRLVASNASGASPSSGLFATTGPGFGVKDFEVSFLNQDGTPDPQAGSHPYEMVTNIAFNTTVLRRQATADSRYMILPDGTSRDVIVDLPPGLVGDPNATATKCTLQELASLTNGETQGGGHCPAESQIGWLEAEFGAESVEPDLENDAFTPIAEPLYNMVAPRGVAAQIGANFVEPNLFINAGVLAGGDYPLQAASLDLPTNLPVIATRLTVWGVPQAAGHNAQRQGPGCESGCSPDSPLKPFLTLPTGCNGPLKSTIKVDSYQEPGHFVEPPPSITHDAAGQPVALTGCSQLEFPPTIEVKPDVPDTSTSTGLTVGVHVSQKAALNPEGLAESSLRDTTVALPPGVAINPAGANGLEACSEGLASFTGFTEFNTEFEPGDETATFISDPLESLQPGVSLCPDGSKIGTVKLKTPLLEHELEGSVYLAAQEANPFGSLVAMYLFIEDPISGSTVKLTGEVRLCESVGQAINGVSCQAVGQIVTTFKNTPDLPFEELELHFFGGERAPLTTPSRCGTYTTQASFTPWDGNGQVNTSSSFQITSGPDGTACPGVSLPFKPELAAGTVNNQAGGFSPFAMTMSRDDGQQNLQAISLNMPPGLSGLLAGVELCPEPQADEGTCGPNSLIGETTVSVGVGSDPFTVKGGKVYITGPYKGAPFGLSIVNPAVAGPFNLGKVIVRAKIEVNPITAALTITSDDEGPYKIPQYIDGIPLQIKHVNVTINRSGFTFNPTNCNKTAITGSLDSTEGATDTLSLPFQATNCATLGFAPKFAASTSGKTSKAKGASLSVKLTYPKAPFGSQANIAKVKVDLPKQLPSRLTTLQKACTAAQFNANPAGCPAASVIGHAKAITPLVPVPLEGPAYFVSHGGEAFPSLIVVLQGYGVTIDLVGTTFISKAGITSTTFKTVPDAPVGSFELTLPEGPYSALGTNKNLCALTHTVTTKKTVKEKVHGKTRRVVKKTTKRVAESLAMPTEFVAQNGAKINESTKISVTGCSNAISIVSHKIKGRTLTVSVSVPAAGTLRASGKGLSRSSKSAKGRETLTFKLTQKKAGKLSTKLKIAFKPSKGSTPPGGSGSSKSLRVKFAK
ncbi:MAG TPA: hypothetical protein VIJ66_00340 [Solirubrobacteraceae bacterium]